MPKNSNWKSTHTYALIFIIIAIVLVGLLFPTDARLWSWLIIMILLAMFIVISGQGILGRWEGALIDERKKMSLSRLQMILWTIVIVSGYLSSALANIANKVPEPLSIEIPKQLWLLMGISTTSLLGSPLIKSTRMNKKLNTANQRKFNILKKGKGIDNVGLIITNNKIENASWGDMFKGEEVSNFSNLDLGKVQMFYFTIILVLAYIVTLGGTLAGANEAITKLPAIDQGMTALIGISHGGYLINKAIIRQEH
jgi:hypothetical protein